MESAPHGGGRGRALIGWFLHACRFGCLVISDPLHGRRAAVRTGCYARVSSQFAALWAWWRLPRERTSLAVCGIS